MTSGAPLLDETRTDPALDALLRERLRVQTWREGPAKKANLAAINRMIAEHHGPSDGCVRGRARLDVHPSR